MKFPVRESLIVASLVGVAGCGSPSQETGTELTLAPDTTSTTAATSTASLAPETGVCTRFPELDSSLRTNRGRIILRFAQNVECEMPVFQSDALDAPKIGAIDKDNTGNPTLFQASCYRIIGDLTLDNAVVQVRYNKPDNQSSEIGWVRDPEGSYRERITQAMPNTGLPDCDVAPSSDQSSEPIVATGVAAN